MKIRYKIHIVILLAITLGAVQLGLLQWVAHERDDAIHRQQVLNRISSATFLLALIGQDIVRHPKLARPRTQWLRVHNELGADLRQPDDVPVEDRDNWERLQRTHSRLPDLIEHLGLLATSVPPGDKMQKERQEWAAHRLNLAIQDMIGEVSTLRQHTEIRSETHIRRIETAALGLGLSITLVIAWLAYLIGKSIATPLERLRQATDRVGAGDLESRVALPGNDEISLFSADFDRMLGRLKDVTASRSELEREVEARRRAEDALLNLNQELESRVQEEVAHNLEKERMLIHQSRLAAMGEMIGNIAHQWRQPLNALSIILGDIDDAYRAGELTPDEMRQSAIDAYRLIQRMSGTIDDFRNFFRPDKKKRPFSLKAAVEDVERLLGASLKSHGIEMVLKVAEDVTGFGYPNEFSQALVNLINNAKDAIVDSGQKYGHIEIAVAREGERGKVAVRDNGGGIPAEALAKLFVPYFTTKESGTGIGLYMSKAIIEGNMGGSLAARNVEGGPNSSSSAPSRLKAKRRTLPSRRDRDQGLPGRHLADHGGKLEALAAEHP